jgi:hypothetical protein
MRGIMLKWAYRLLGKPYWKKGGHERLGFGDARNIKFARCVISAESCSADPRQAKLDVVDTLKIQSNKHNCELDTCDPMISFIHTILFGTLTHSYSHCNDGINKGPKGRMTPWKLDEFYRELIKNWGPPKEKKEMKQAARAEASLVAVGGASTTANTTTATVDTPQGPATQIMVAATKTSVAATNTLAQLRSATAAAVATAPPISNSKAQVAPPTAAAPAPPIGNSKTHIAPPAAAAPPVSNSKTQIAPHERGTSKSPRDIMAAAMDLRNWLQNSTIDDLVKEASSETVSGLQEVFKALDHARACLTSLGVKSK